MGFLLAKKIHGNGRMAALDSCQNQRLWMTWNGHIAPFCTNNSSFGVYHGNLKEDRCTLYTRQNVTETLGGDTFRQYKARVGISWVPWRGGEEVSSDSDGVVRAGDF